MASKSKLFSAAYAKARRNFSDEELHIWHEYYTIGNGAGGYTSVKPHTSFRDFIINSEAESEYCTEHDI